MGKAVAAVFTTHVPRLMIADPVARRAYMGRHVTTFYDAMPKLVRERLRHLEFDTFFLIDTHWLSTLEYVLNAHERLSGVFTSEELPAMLHEPSNMTTGATLSLRAESSSRRASAGFARLRPRIATCRCTIPP